MAVIALSCLWMLLLAGSCVRLAAAAECGTECARCVFSLRGQKSAFSTLSCSLECDGVMDSQRLRLCKDFLFETDEDVSVDAELHQQPDQLAVDPAMADEAASPPQHLIAKKYGGFMKGYGGFMSRSLSAQTEPRNLNEEENIRLGILKMISATEDQGMEEGDDDKAAAQRYGGFHRVGEVVRGKLLEAVLGHGLRKRYGGFMRRVGRPEWLVDSSKAGGTLKTSWENGSGLQKRYGGFMD
ncbi:PREDICTED: proenkephalin-A [Cyprinodon variegatus]|uniref:Proenkephalin a n=1 Tax=Cyprinodon variegatus TaxID=28743 RepID=A0A3Q2DHR6_CYPVA|nr:PREDICTED: proenkephalin-A [Cyprinodon variegatus]